MQYHKKCRIWPPDGIRFFPQFNIFPRKQVGPTCVYTTLAQLTGKNPEDFENEVNTQDPVTWSVALQKYDLKLAYCPTDLRKVKFIKDELLEIYDLFLLAYYSPTDSSIMNDPDGTGWICGSHIVTVFQDKVYDTKLGYAVPLVEHESLEKFLKRLFRVVPSNHERGL